MDDDRVRQTDSAGNSYEGPKEGLDLTGDHLAEAGGGKTVDAVDADVDADGETSTRYLPDEVDPDDLTDLQRDIWEYVTKFPGATQEEVAEATESSATHVSRTTADYIDWDPQENREDGPYACDHCGEEFETTSGLGGHMSANHTDGDDQGEATGTQGGETTETDDTASEPPGSQVDRLIKQILRTEDSLPDGAALSVDYQAGEPITLTVTWPAPATPPRPADQEVGDGG